MDTIIFTSKRLYLALCEPTNQYWIKGDVVSRYGAGA
jgi:hypothetical protein